MNLKVAYKEFRLYLNPSKFTHYYIFVFLVELLLTCGTIPILGGDSVLYYDTFPLILGRLLNALLQKE